MIPIGITKRQGITGLTLRTKTTNAKNRKPIPHSITDRNRGENFVIAKSASGFDIPQLTIDAIKIKIFTN
jgi:hypothetical protein